MRLPGWESRLAEMVQRARQNTFDWGFFDCMTFMSDAAFAICAKDPMEGLRGTYHDARSAYEVLNELGGVEAALEERLGGIGCRKVDVNYAQRGDIVIAQQEPLASRVGVVYVGKIIGPAQSGLGSHERPQGGYAWAF